MRPASRWRDGKGCLHRCVADGGRPARPPRRGGAQLRDGLDQLGADADHTEIYRTVTRDDGGEDFSSRNYHVTD